MVTLEIENWEPQTHKIVTNLVVRAWVWGVEMSGKIGYPGNSWRGRRRRRCHLCLFRILGEFNAVKNKRNMVELGGFGQGFDYKVVCFRGWVAVVRSEEVDESGEKMVGCVLVFFFLGSCCCWLFKGLQSSVLSHEVIWEDKTCLRCNTTSFRKKGDFFKILIKKL